MPLKLFLTCLIGSFASAALSFINENLGHMGIFLTGCFFGYFEATERKPKDVSLSE